MIKVVNTNPTPHGIAVSHSFPLQDVDDSNLVGDKVGV